jgi:peptidoglycan L-alanyl-D-glutamate endopeptidase CwlK
MPSFSRRSKQKLETCHPDIQKVFNKVIETVDCTILEGVRDLETQKEYVRTGRSTTLKSKHLKQSDGYSHAVDVAIYPIKWGSLSGEKQIRELARNYMFAGYVKAVADNMNIKFRLGADWDNDWELNDQNFHDIVHFELVK